MKSFKINFFLVAAMLLIGVSVSAFTLLSVDGDNNTKQATTWYFTGNSNEILNASKYTDTGSQPSDCATEGASPCSIQVDADDQIELQAFLDQHSEQDVLQMSSQRRP